MKTARKAFVIIAAAAFASCPLFASYPRPIGFWQFNDSNNLTQSTLGANLIESGTHTAVAGIGAGDGAIWDPLSSYLRCDHGILPNGGGIYVNNWTVLFDVKIPDGSIGDVETDGHWTDLYQTNMTNSNDGDCFISWWGDIGVEATGYTTPTYRIAEEVWYRIIVSVSNTNFYRIYVDGVKWLEGTAQPRDGRFALDPQILFFADDSGEDYPLSCTNLAIWGQALTDAQVGELGGVSIPISTATDTNSAAGVNHIANPTAESSLLSWTIADGNDWQATNRTDWHWPRTNNYYFTPGRSGHSEINQIISLSYLAADIDSGIVAANAKGYIGGGSDGDMGKIILEYRNSSNAIIATADSGWVDGANSVNWTEVLVNEGYTLPVGTRSVKYRLLAQRADGSDCDAFFDDLSWEFTRVVAGNTAPGVPSIAGSSSVSTGTSTAYTFAAADAETNTVGYQIDWGNGISSWSDLQASGTNYNVSHSWPVLGVYAVRARARDNNGAVGQWSAAYNVTVSGNPAGVYKSQPYLQNVSKTAMTISWETDCVVEPSVDWGLTTSYGNNTKGLCINAGLNGTAVIYICKVRISGLEPGTTYHFQANNGSTAKSDGTFTTAPNEDTPFNFAVWGDSQQVPQRLNNDPADHPECATAMFTDMANNVDIAVSTGDVVDDSSYTWYRNAFRPYAVNILGKQKPFFVAFGNHDEPETSLVHNAVQNSGMGTFSFNYGNAHFTCVNYSQCNDGTLPSDGHISSLPLAWLQEDLSSEDAQNATWRFLFIHVPPYCERWFDGSGLMQQYLVPLLEQYNVQVCFSGHTHEYERGMRNGVFYVITGCSSYLDIIEPITENWPFMTVGGAQNTGVPEGGGLIHGWTEVDIDGTELNLNMHAYNLDGTSYGVIDTIHFALSDFNMDKNVNAKDLAELADVWLDAGQYSSKDIADRSNKTINMKDLAEFALYWQYQGQF